MINKVFKGLLGSRSAQVAVVTSMLFVGYLGYLYLVAPLGVRVHNSYLSNEKGFIDAAVYVYDKDGGQKNLLGSHMYADLTLTPGEDISTYVYGYNAKYPDTAFLKICLASTPSSQKDGVNATTQRDFDRCQTEASSDKDRYFTSCYLNQTYASIGGSLVRLFAPYGAIEADASCRQTQTVLSYMFNDNEAVTANKSAVQGITEQAQTSLSEFAKRYYTLVTQRLESSEAEAQSAIEVDSDNQLLSYDTDTHALAISGGNTVSFGTASSVTDGVLSADDWSKFNAKENVLNFSEALVRAGNTVELMSCAAGQILKNDGSAWLCASDISGAGNTYSAGSGITIDGSNVIANSGTLGVTASGAIASSGGQNPALTLNTSTDLVQLGNQLALSSTGVAAGSYNSVTVDERGRVVSGTNLAYLTTEGDGVVGNEVSGVINGGGLVMSGAGTSADPYQVGLISSCGAGQILKWNSGWACANDTDTDAQTLTFNPGTNQLSISAGNTIDLSSLATDTDTDDQALSLSGDTLSLSDGGTVDLSPYLDNTDNQALGYNAGTRTLSLTNGGSVVLPADQDTTYSAGNGLSLSGTVFAINAPTCAGNDKLTWNGSAFACAADVDTDTDTDTDAQTISWNNGTRTLSISGGNSVVVPDADTDTDQQSLSYNATTREVSISGGLGFTLPLADGITPGLLSAADWNTFNGKENVLSFSDGLNRAGDNITLMDCAANQVLQRNGVDTAWLCANQVTDTNTTYSAGSGLTLTGTTFALEGTSVTAGTYNSLTVDTLGRVTAATNVSYLTSEQDAVVGNEVAAVAASGGLVMSGAGTSGDPYKVGLITTCADNQLLKYTAAGGWACASDNSAAGTDSQSLSWNTLNNELTISGGNTVDLSSLKDNTDTQDLSWNGGTRTLSLTDGGSVVISDTDTTYSAGDGLALTGTVFSIDSPTCSGSDKLTWNGTAFSCAADQDTTYAAGTGITITAGTIDAALGTSIDSSEITNGTITSTDLDNSGAVAGTYGDSGVSVAQLTVDGAGRITSVSNRALPTASGTTSGVLTSADWNTFNGKENMLSFSDGLSRSGNNVTLMDCAANQVLQRNGGDTAWVCANQVTDTNTTYSAGTGLTLTGTTFALEGTSVTAGTYNNVTVDTLGRVTGGSNVSYLTSESDATIGNEVAGVVNNGGLVMSGAGTSGDPYKLGLITTCGDGQLLKYTAAGGWACASDTDTDTDTDTDDQTLSYNTGTNILTIAGGNTVDLSTLEDNTDSQSLSIAGNVISLTNGGSVTLPADQDTTYTAGNGLDLTGTVFAINSPTCSGTDKLSWNGTAFVCSADVDTTYTASTGITITAGAIAATLGTDISTSEIVDGTITSTDLDASGATAGTYGNTGVQVAQLTVDAAGRITAVSNRTISNANTTTTGVLSSTDWNTFNGKENVLAFTGNGLFSRSGDTVTGLSCATAGHVATWNGTAFVCQAPSGGGVASLNGLNGALTIDTGTAGSDFAASASGSTITLDLPDASATARGLVTTGAQTFGGAKTFSVGANAVAFNVSNASLPVFNIDTTNNKVSIGSDTTDATAISLVLDSYNNGTDPTGTNGALYYNSALAKFRCYEGGSWKDCISSGGGAGPTKLLVTANVSNNLVTFADVTGLTTPVTAGQTYTFDCKLSYTTAASTTAIQLAANGPVSTNISYSTQIAYSATAEFQASQTVFDTAGNPGTGGAATRYPADVWGSFTPTVNGTFALRLRSEVATSNVTVVAGSYCLVY